jgi:phage baseplate assembly protein W|tara:strand:+ start:265 stop:684 length:420 start_codon:yes stop_codon:yes gene_type:complete
MAIDIKNESSTIVSKNLWKDLDLLFRVHPVTGDVVTRTDVEAVKRSVRNIVLTNKYERPFKPNFGTSLRELLFELNTSRQLKKVQRRIKETLEKTEPRIMNVSVLLSNNDSHEVNITIVYDIKNSIRNQEQEFTVTRAR